MRKEVLNKIHKLLQREHIVYGFLRKVILIISKGYNQKREKSHANIENGHKSIYNRDRTDKNAYLQLRRNRFAA